MKKWLDEDEKKFMIFYFRGTLCYFPPFDLRPFIFQDEQGRRGGKSSQFLMAKSYARLVIFELKENFFPFFFLFSLESRIIKARICEKFSINLIFMGITCFKSSGIKF